MKKFICLLSVLFTCSFAYSQNSINYNVTVENGAQLTNWTTSLYQTFYPGEDLKIYASGQVDIKPEIREETKSQLFGLIKNTIRYTVNNLHYSCQQPQHTPYSYTFISNKNNFIFLGRGNCNNPSNALIENISIPYNNNPFEEFSLKTKLLSDSDLRSETLPSAGQYIFNVQIDFSRRLTIIDNYIQELSNKGSLNSTVVDTLKKDRKLVDSKPIEVSDILKRIIRNSMNDTIPDKKTILEFCLELNPTDIDLMAVAGKCFAAQGEFDEAEMNLRSAIKGYIQDPTIIETKSMAVIKSMAEGMLSLDNILTNNNKDYLNDATKLKFAAYCLKTSINLFEKIFEFERMLESAIKYSQNVKLLGDENQILDAIKLIEYSKGFLKKKTDPIFGYLDKENKNAAQIKLINYIIKNKWFVLDTMTHKAVFKQSNSLYSRENYYYKDILNIKYLSKLKYFIPPQQDTITNFIFDINSRSLNYEEVQYKLLDKLSRKSINKNINSLNFDFFSLNFLGTILKHCYVYFDKKEVVCDCEFRRGIEQEKVEKPKLVIYFNDFQDKIDRIVISDQHLNPRFPSFFLTPFLDIGGGEYIYKFIKGENFSYDPNFDNPEDKVSTLKFSQNIEFLNTINYPRSVTHGYSNNATMIKIYK